VRIDRRLVALAAVTVVAAPGNAAAGPRPDDPVVLRGAAVPSLRGATPGRVVAFARRDGEWRQVPIQVDQRKRVDLGRVYGGEKRGVLVWAYADPLTFTGADQDRFLDGNDEIALMARDSGAQAPKGTPPPYGVKTNHRRVELALTDPATGRKRYVSLFRSEPGLLDPAAGQRYVSYRFSLDSGGYRQTYHRNTGPNPEHSEVVTAAYRRTFADRWIDDGLSIEAGDATRVDILDRHREQFGPGSCFRTEDSFSEGEGAFVTNRAGPVRAIRTYIGANSGPFTEREHVFYRAREVIVTTLRVHGIPGAMDVLDYSEAARGMTYRASTAHSGVGIDGEDDDVPRAPRSWEQAAGPQGILTSVTRFATNLEGFRPRGYYLDADHPPGGQQTCTGDGQALGVSGPWIDRSIPNTDPSLGKAAKVKLTRTLFYDAPRSRPATLAEARADQAFERIHVSVRVLP
jgi:hypothetical protein